MAISKEKLIKGRKYQENFYLDGEDYVVLQSLSIGEVEKFTSKTKNDMEVGYMLVCASLVEPKLTIDEIKEMEQKDFINISNRVIEISGVNAEKVQTEVENFRQEQ